MFVLPWKLMEDMPSKQVHLHNNSMSNLMTKLFPYSSTDLTPSPRYYLHKREKVTLLRNNVSQLAFMQISSTSSALPTVCTLFSAGPSNSLMITYTIGTLFWEFKPDTNHMTRHMIDQLGHMVHLLNENVLQHMKISWYSFTSFQVYFQFYLCSERRFLSRIALVNVQLALGIVLHLVLK